MKQENNTDRAVKIHNTYIVHFAPVSLLSKLPPLFVIGKVAMLTKGEENDDYDAPAGGGYHDVPDDPPDEDTSSCFSSVKR